MPLALLRVLGATSAQDARTATAVVVVAALVGFLWWPARASLRAVTRRADQGFRSPRLELVPPSGGRPIPLSANVTVGGDDTCVLRLPGCAEGVALELLVGGDGVVAVPRGGTPCRLNLHELDAPQAVTAGDHLVVDGQELLVR